MRILIVGRTHHMGEYLTRALSEAGFVVDWMRDGPDSHIQAGSEDYDLVILDLALSCAEAWLGPGHDDRGEGTPLLLLGSLQENNADGRQDAVDANRGTRFEFPKLLKQIRNLLHCGDDASILKLADLQLNLKRRSATRQGRSILLTSKEFSLLWLLMRHQGEILPRAIIASQVWDMNFSSGTNVVDVLVRRLRLKIDNGQFPKLFTRSGTWGTCVRIAPGNWECRQNRTGGLLPFSRSFTVHAFVWSHSTHRDLIYPVALCTIKSGARRI